MAHLNAMLTGLMICEVHLIQYQTIFEPKNSTCTGQCRPKLMVGQPNVSCDFLFLESIHRVKTPVTPSF